MADKLTPLILDALSRAAAEPAGMPLYGTKSDPGLFATTAAAKSAARKALDDGLLRVVGTEAKGKTTRELAAVTEKGLQHLLDQVSPKQVLEDFVRALERREGQVTDLLGTAGRMADSLDGLKRAVSVVLPRVQSGRVSLPPNPPAPFPGREGGEILPPSPLRGGAGGGVNNMNGVATLEAPAATAVDTLEDLADAVLARLADWAASAVAGQDCPLPELYKSLTTREVPPSIGTYHDCLRQLHAQHKVYLHPWTGPLYALPEPAYALLVGHNIAYYASAKQG